MPDLIFHIGMPKCASGTIQNKVFYGTPGYLGTGKQVPVRENFAKQFQTFCPIGPRFRGNMGAARKWRNQVLQHGAEAWPGIERLIASTEFLTSRNKLHPRPIVPFLKRFSRDVWLDGQVKVILVLRNQADRIASGYAQISSGIYGASQAHFEGYVSRLLKHDAKLLDLSSWVEDLFQALGNENICVLLMEEIGSVSFWNNLKTFTNLEEFDATSMISENGMNQRKTSANTWRISEFSAWNRSKSQAGKVVGLLWPGGRWHLMRRRTALTFAGGFSLLHSMNPARLRERHRGDCIVLTDEIRQRIREQARPYNDRLSMLLEKDLSAIGY